MSKQAERIKELRTQLGLSQEELAEKIGVSQRQVSRYETWGSPIPSDVLARMVELLNVNSDYLIGRIDDPTPYQSQGELSPLESDVLAALRRGDQLAAIRIISGA